MGVTEIIEQIKQLKPEELLQVKAVVDEATSSTDGPTPEQLARGLAIRDEMDAGLVDCKRTDLSQNIDQALYREDA